MTSRKTPGPKEVKAAAQAAADTVQSIAGGAMRIPPATAQLAGQLPDLLENLVSATERLNEAIDRAERYMALADPDDSNHGSHAAPTRVAGRNRR